MGRAAAGERIDHLLSSLRLGTTTVGIGRSGAFYPLSLFCVKILVRFGEQFFDAFAIAAVGGYADTGGERRLFSVLRENFAETSRHPMPIVFPIASPQLLPRALNNRPSPPPTAQPPTPALQSQEP